MKTKPTISAPARRGDLIAYRTRSEVAFCHGSQPSSATVQWRLAYVTGITREGEVREYTDDGRIKSKGRPVPCYIIQQTKADTQALFSAWLSVPNRMDDWWTSFHNEFCGPEIETQVLLECLTNFVRLWKL